jgi:hypothetical protein
MLNYSKQHEAYLKSASLAAAGSPDLGLHKITHSTNFALQLAGRRPEQNHNSKLHVYMELF